MVCHRNNGKHKKCFSGGNNGNIIGFFHFEKFGTGMTENDHGSLKMVHY
jgi:hypothetical protein